MGLHRTRADKSRHGQASRLVTAIVGGAFFMTPVSVWAQPNVPEVPPVPDLGANEGANAGRNIGPNEDGNLGQNIEIGDIDPSNVGPNQRTPRVGRFGRALRSAELGLTVDTEDRTVVVSSLEADGVSAGAGLQEGDKILAVNRKWVRSSDDLTNRLRESAQEDGRAWLYVERDGDRHWVNLDFSGRGQGAWGLTANRRDDELRVVHVNEGSAAGRAGLRADDKIVSVDGERVMSGRELDGRLRAAARRDGEAVIGIERDGQTQEITARLRGAGDSAENAGALANARLRRLQRRIDAMIGNENDLSTRRLERVRANAEDVRARIAELGNDNDRGAADRLRNRLAIIRTELRDMADDVNGDRRFELDEMISLATELQSQISALVGTAAEPGDVAADAGADARARANAAVDELEASLQEFEAEGDAQEQVARIRESANELISQARAMTGEAGEATQEASRQVRRRAAALRRELNDVAQNAGEQVSGQIDEIRDNLAALDESISGLAQGTAETSVSTAADVEARVRGQAEGIVNRLTELSQNATGEPQARVTATRDRAVQLLDRLAGRVGERAEQIDERLNQARDTVADLYREVDELADGAEGEGRTQLNEVRDALGELRSDLSDYARDTVRSARTRAFDASEEISDRVQRAMTRVEVLADRLRAVDANQVEGAQDRISQVREQVEQLQGQIRGFVENSEQIEQDAINGARDAATSVAAELQEIAASAEGEARQQLDELHSLAAEFQAELQAMALARAQLAGEATAQVNAADADVQVSAENQAEADVSADADAEENPQ